MGGMSLWPYWHENQISKHQLHKRLPALRPASYNFCPNRRMWKVLEAFRAMKWWENCDVWSLKQSVGGEVESTTNTNPVSCFTLLHATAPINHSRDGSSWREQVRFKWRINSCVEFSHSRRFHHLAPFTVDWGRGMRRIIPQQRGQLEETRKQLWQSC